MTQSLNDLRARLEAQIAGRDDRPRGHAMTPVDIEIAWPIARACNTLFFDVDGREFVAPPSELLPPLP